jgi:hypothetical protein
MRFAILLSTLLAGTVAVYPEASFSTASRTTELTKAPSSSPSSTLLTDDMIDGWVRKWTQRLGLSDWKIDSKIVRIAQLPRGTVANIHWSLPRRTATIKVLHPADSTLPASEIVRDTELSVVHELVHLSMAKLPLDGSDTDLEEEAVKKLSVALISLEKQTADPTR